MCEVTSCITRQANMAQLKLLGALIEMYHRYDSYASHDRGRLIALPAGLRGCPCGREAALRTVREQQPEPRKTLSSRRRPGFPFPKCLGPSAMGRAVGQLSFGGQG